MINNPEAFAPSTPWAGIPITGPLMRVEEAAKYVGYSRRQYYELVRQGDLPPLIKMGRTHSGAIATPKAHLDAVIAARAAESAAA
jgi:excisionase family DNA binding protein